MASSDTHEAQPMVHPELMLLLSFIVAALFQIAIYKWRKYHYRSFLMTSLLGLWILPVIIAITFGNRIFILTWIIYLGMTCILLRLSLKHPVDPATPRKVYGFYRFLFNSTLIIGFIGYFAFVMNTFVVMSSTLFEYSIVAIFYALYYGVLSRDMIDLMSDIMASNLGYYNPTGFPEKHLKPFICAICGGNISVNVSEDAGFGQEDPLKAEISVTLECQHKFHEFCLRGWSLIGKKDHCPYCKEKVDMRLFDSNPWRNPEFVYGKFLDFIRYMIVWNPIMLLLLNIVIYISGY